MPRQKSKNGKTELVRIPSTLCPAIEGRVYRRISPLDGHAELWWAVGVARKIGKRECFTDDFLVRHQAAVKEATDLACDWIKQHPNAADGPTSSNRVEPPSSPLAA